MRTVNVLHGSPTLAVKQNRITLGDSRVHVRLIRAMGRRRHSACRTRLWAVCGQHARFGIANLLLRVGYRRSELRPRIRNRIPDWIALLRRLPAGELLRAGHFHPALSGFAAGCSSHRRSGRKRARRHVFVRDWAGPADRRFPRHFVVFRRNGIDGVLGQRRPGSEGGILQSRRVGLRSGRQSVYRRFHQSGGPANR